MTRNVLNFQLGKKIIRNVVTFEHEVKEEAFESNQHYEEEGWEIEGFQMFDNFNKEPNPIDDCDLSNEPFSPLQR